MNTNLYQFVTIADTANVIFWNAFVPNYYRRSFYALMSVKECVVYHDSLSNRVDEKMNYTRKSNSPGFTLYQNNDFIPMGFTYDTFISENTIDSLKNMTPQPDVPKVLLSHLVVPSSDKTTFAKLLKEANKEVILPTNALYTASQALRNLHVNIPNLDLNDWNASDVNYEIIK